MKDWEIAREQLLKEQQTLVIVKDSRVLYSSVQKGILPMYEAVSQLKEQLQGAAVADRVIGKAAAMLISQFQIAYLHTEIISEAAKEKLEKAGIPYSYEKSVPYIQNRSKTDLCPVEKLSQGVEQVEELKQKISAFLNSLKESKNEDSSH